MKFRKKPLEIEAIQFTGANWPQVRAFCGRHHSLKMEADVESFVPVDIETGRRDPNVAAEVWDRLHDTWVGVKPNQWIARGIEGELYPIDDEVFARTYERVLL